LAGVIIYRIIPSKYDLPLSEANAQAVQMPGLSPMQFWNTIRTEGDTWLVVDIRTLEAFRKGHIKGAVNIPVGDILGRKHLRKLSKARVLIYGENEVVAHEAALLLRMTGVDATPVNGGYVRLNGAGFDQGNAPALFFSEEKVQYNYRAYFKSFEVIAGEPAEIKVPLPKPGGC
jgi:rhodanese-related sulfurtransferase